MAEHEPPAVTAMFGASGFMDSLRGGRRFIGYRVERRPRWWSRRPWVVLLDYDGGRIHDRAVPVGWYRTLDEANAAAARSWRQVEADHAQALAHQEQRRRDREEPT